MAWNFAAQIHALTGFDADDASTATETGDTFSVLANKWLEDAAKEIINVLPPNLLRFCTSTTSFTSAAVGSEAEILNTGKVLSVFAGNYEARAIPSTLKHKANDPNDINYATTTDPIFYVENSKLNVLPASLTCKYEEVQYPAITYNMTAIGSGLVVTGVAGEADDEVFTLNSHGFEDGDKVKLSDFSGDTSLNGIVSVIESKTTNTFKLANVTIDADATGGTAEKLVSGFPDEAEHLVVLRAAITAAEYMLMTEEDPEIYLPMIQNLKQDYNQGLQALGVQMAQPQQAGR